MIRPILFNTDMVRAILDGRKTVTRRRVKPKQLSGVGCMQCPNNLPEEFLGVRESMFKPFCDMPDNKLIGKIYKPPCERGDILYVRETWQHLYELDGNEDIIEGTGKYYYAATDAIPFDTYVDPEGVKHEKTPWRPSIHMPKKAARIWLKITNVSVERLQDMTLDDFLAESACLNPEAFNDPENAYEQAKHIFTEIWNSTIKKRDQDLYGWDSNPWVWVIKFERCEKPEGWCV